jgi:hypothetical protein
MSTRLGSRSLSERGMNTLYAYYVSRESFVQQFSTLIYEPLQARFYVYYSISLCFAVLKTTKICYMKCGHQNPSNVDGMSTCLPVHANHNITSACLSSLKDRP